MYGTEIAPELLSGGEYRAAANVNLHALSYCFRAYSSIRGSDLKSGTTQEDKAAVVFAQLVINVPGHGTYSWESDGGPSSTTTAGLSTRGSCSGLPSISKLCDFVNSQCSTVLNVLQGRSDMAEEMENAMSTSSDEQSTTSSNTAFVLIFFVRVFWLPLQKLWKTSLVRDSFLLQNLIDSISTFLDADF